LQSEFDQNASFQGEDCSDMLEEIFPKNKPLGGSKTEGVGKLNIFILFRPLFLEYLSI